VTPDRVILREVGQRPSAEARRFALAFASDFGHHDVLENVRVPTTLLAPGMRLCRTTETIRRKPNNNAHHICCLADGLDPANDLLELYRKAFKKGSTDDAIHPIREVSQLRNIQNLIVLVGPRAYTLLQNGDHILLETLSGAVTAVTDLICVLPNGILQRADELAVSLANPTPNPWAPQMVAATGLDAIEEQNQNDVDDCSDKTEPDF
jgi:hypothetical protein